MIPCSMFCIAVCIAGTFCVGKKIFMNFANTLQFVKIFPHKHFALVIAKPSSSLSTVVLTPTFAAINEAVKKVIKKW